MTRRSTNQGETFKRPPETTDFGLFAVPAYQGEIPTPQPESASEKAAIEGLMQDMVALVERMKPRYTTLTTDDIRREAVELGLLREKGTGREYAFLGVVCRKAGLIGTENMVRSQREGAHGTPLRVWRTR